MKQNRIRFKSVWTPTSKVNWRRSNQPLTCRKQAPKKRMTLASVLVILTAWFLAPGLCYSNEEPRPTTELLWPDGAPGAKGDTPNDKPELTFYLPVKSKATGAAVVICPGGGYGHLAMGHEGHQVAKWLNTFGVAGIILKYRHKGSGYAHPAPLQDVQRAIKSVRYRAKTLGIDPEKIGVMGFSAGGHLASSAGTHFNENPSKTGDAIDKVSARPDFMILIYPVVTMADDFTHKGSRRNLLGNNPTPEMIKYFSNEKQVTPQTPPTFLVHSNDDGAVPAENSIQFFLELRKAGVSAEMHIYKKGGHGYGMGRKGTGEASWPLRCVDWMNAEGLLRTPKTTPVAKINPPKADKIARSH